jgi:hypothetical protein
VESAYQCIGYHNFSGIMLLPILFFSSAMAAREEMQRYTFSDYEPENLCNSLKINSSGGRILISPT